MSIVCLCAVTDTLLVSTSDRYTDKHIPERTGRQTRRCLRSCAGRCVGREPGRASWSWGKEAPGWSSGSLWHWRAAGKPPLTWPGPSDGSLAHIWCRETACWGHKLLLNSPAKTQMQSYFSCSVLCCVSTLTEIRGFLWAIRFAVWE